MGLVLTALFTLSLILDLMKVIFTPKESIKKKQPTDKPSPAPITPQDSDQKLIAAISAAIAAYRTDTTTPFKINTIRQIHKNTPVWALTSRQRQTSGRL